MTVINLQRKVSVEIGSLREFAGLMNEEVLEARSRSFSVALISDKRMRELNHLFRDKDSTTDVLSFPYEADEFDPDKENLGDIVISVEQAERQAADNDLTLDAEIKQLMLHGLLHLCGYDHETDKGEMDRRERELRRKLKI